MATEQKINLKDLSLTETENLAIKLGKKRFTGRQLFKWIFKHGVDEFNKMTDLSQPFRELLEERCCIKKISCADTLCSSDGTIKNVWDIGDDIYIESVLIPDDNRLTLCISSQAGCPIGCSFCATGRNGFKRNLTSCEIYDQYLLTRQNLKSHERITNIVVMGMGEPFLNYDNVIKASSILTAHLGAKLSSKKITISTVGLIDSIYRLAEENPKFSLAISLHSANDDIRRQLIPVAKKYPLAKLKKASIYYAEKSANRVTFEYLLMKNINDSLDDAKMLADFVSGIPCKFNLILYNEIENSGYKKPGEKTVLAFRDYLYPRTPAVTLRKSKGADIAAACGQLAGKRNK